MTPEDAQYLFDERVGIMMEDGVSENQAVQAGRREAFAALKGVGMPVGEISVIVSKLHKWE